MTTTTVASMSAPVRLILACMVCFACLPHPTYLPTAPSSSSSSPFLLPRSEGHTQRSTTVDFLLISPGLRVTRHLQLLTLRDIVACGGMPGPLLPSDHQSLLACFEWA